MSKFIASIIDFMNHDASMANIYTPTDKIHQILAKYNNREVSGLDIWVCGISRLIAARKSCRPVAYRNGSSSILQEIAGFFRFCHRKCQMHLEQIPVQFDLKASLLGQRQILGYGQPQAAALRGSRLIPSDKPLCQFLWFT